MINLKAHLTTDELAARWGTHVNTIQRWRTAGVGPKFIRLGLKRILYPLVEVEAYEAQTLASTVENRAVKNGPRVARRNKKPR